MKTVQALMSFAGIVNMSKGQVKDIPDDLTKDLLKGGLVKEEKPKKPQGQKGGKADEDQ